MAIYASIQGLGALGYQKYGTVPGTGPMSKGPLPECISAAKALLASGKAGVLPSQCYADQLPGPACGGSCKSELQRVASGASARMVQRSGPLGDKTCLQNAMSTRPVACKNGKPVDTAVPGTAMDAATEAASAGDAPSDQSAGGGATEDQWQQEPASSPWPMRIGIGLGVGALAAGLLYVYTKSGRG